MENGELDASDRKVQRVEAESDGRTKEAVDEHMRSVYTAAHGAQQRGGEKRRKLEEEQN